MSLCDCDCPLCRNCCCDCCCGFDEDCCSLETALERVHERESERKPILGGEFRLSP